MQVRMPFAAVVRAAVVGISADHPVRGFFGFHFTRDEPPVVSAGDQPTRVGQLRFVIDLEIGAELLAHAVKRRPVNQLLKLSRIPLALILHFADVRAVVQDAVQGRFGETRASVGVDNPLPRQRVDQRLNRHRLICEQFEDTFDLGRVERVMLDDAATQRSRTPNGPRATITRHDPATTGTSADSRRAPDAGGERAGRFATGSSWNAHTRERDAGRMTENSSTGMTGDDTAWKHEAKHTPAQRANRAPPEAVPHGPDTPPAAPRTC